jgi:hypothetical protein
VDGSIVNADIADKTITLGKISGSGARTQHALIWDGSAWTTVAGYHAVKMIYDAILTWPTTGNSVTLSVPDASYYGWCVTWSRNLTTYTDTGKVVVQTVDGSSITAGTYCGSLVCYRISY